MLLDLAEALNPMLDARAARLENKQATTEEEDAAQTTLQLIFFDGEEAFQDWTDTDSIYGSRYAFGSNYFPRRLNILFSTLAPGSQTSRR